MTTQDNSELREKIRHVVIQPTGNQVSNNMLDEIMQALQTEIDRARLEMQQQMAMCTDDKTFLEMHKHANYIEVDEKLKRPSKAIYVNRQWEAEMQGLQVLAALVQRLEDEKANLGKGESV